MDPSAATTTPPDAEPYIGPRDAAAFLGVHVDTLYDLITRKRHPLPAVRVGGQWRLRRSQMITWASAEAERARR